MLNDKKGINDNELNIDNSGDVEKNNQKAKNNSRINSSDTMVNNNIIYDPNKVKFEMAIQIANIKKEFKIGLKDLFQNCKNCQENQIEKLNKILKEKEQLKKKYNDRIDENGLIFMADPDIATIFKLINDQLTNAKNGYDILPCAKHKKEYKNLRNMQIEIESLTEAIELIR